MSIVSILLLFLCGIFILLGVVGYVIYWIKFKHIIDVTKNLPSLPSLPIIGHLHHLIGKTPQENSQIFFNFIETYGTTAKFWFGPNLIILLNEPQDVEQVVNNIRCIDKSYMYTLMKPWLQEGLLLSKGKKWHQRRKILTPAFHFEILKQFVEVFEKQSRIFVRNLDKEYRMQTENGFDLHKLLSLCTLDVMCESAMGVTINAQTNADSEYVRAIKTLAKVLHKRMFDIKYHFDFTYKFTKLAREGTKALSVIHSFAEDIILKRRNDILKSQTTRTPSVEADTVEGKKKKMAFLDVLLHSECDGKPLSNLDIREEVDTFMFEGHDTTSSALLFCCYNLAVNQECQQKCVEEIVEVLGKDNAKPCTYEVLNELHYLEQCIKESLRIFPPVPLMGRYISEECRINGKIIPAGTDICISSIIMGRQKESFPDPLVFKPERFANGGMSTTKLNPYAYIPFAAGPRNCIGQKFAMLELKTILANSLRHYEFEWLGNRDEELQIIGELVLHPLETLMFKLKPRAI